MAGAGYKLFNTGDVLLASEVNTYLQQQVTMVFANATARTSALSGVLAEGMMSYLQDTNTVEVYNGSSWVNVGNAGDITEVQAGTGISVASGTGPIPVVTNDMATTITAAGDIVVGTGSGTYDNLPIGTTGQVLTADTSVSPYKVKWAAAAGGGKVLQVVNAEITSSVQIASTTFTDTNVTATITPTSATSKILVLYSGPVRVYRDATYTPGCGIQLLRGATTILEHGSAGTGNRFFEVPPTPSGNTGMNRGNVIYLDSPATTSATTYKIQGRVATTANGAFVEFQLSGEKATITLMEIGA